MTNFDLTAERAETTTEGRTALILFGIAQIVIGIGCVALAFFVAASAELAARAQLPPSGAKLASGLVLYGLGALHFIAVGIASIRGRRWARAMSIAVSGLWLAGGIVATCFVALNLGHTGMMRLLVVLLLAVGLPAALFFFYRSEPARLAFLKSDPRPSWADRTPLPVLAVALVMALASVSLLANLASPAVPMFGTVLTGAPGAMALFALSVLCAFLAVGLFRLKESAWWTLVLLQVLGIIGGTLGILRGENNRPMVVALLVATWVGYFAFLLYLRRYFAITLVPRTRKEDVRA